LSSATFTFRIPDSMTGRLSSGEMRSWLTRFLRDPQPLPPDPGSGDERTSLTLPRELVRGASEYLRCSPSTALRRIAAGHLGANRPPADRDMRPVASPPVTSAPGIPGGAWSPVPGGYWRKPANVAQASTRPTGAQVAALVIQALLYVFVVCAVVFFTARKGKAQKRT
jgi:hypothetical protein